MKIINWDHRLLTNETILVNNLFYEFCYQINTVDLSIFKSFSPGCPFISSWDNGGSELHENSLGSRDVSSLLRQTSGFRRQAVAAGENRSHLLRLPQTRFSSTTHPLGPRWRWQGWSFKNECTKHFLMIINCEDVFWRNIY